MTITHTHRNVTVRATPRRTAYPPQSRQHQHGWLSVETSLVLVVVAIVLGGIFYAFLQNSRSVEVNANVAAITTTAGNMKKNYGRANQYGVLTTALLVQGRMIPDNLRATSTTATNSYGNPITVAVSPAATCGGTANACTDLTWAGIPQDQCVDVVSGSAGTSRVITVGGQTVKALNNELNMSNLTAACEADVASTAVFTIGR